MKKLILILLVASVTINIFSTELLTVAEQSNYKKTSLYKDVIKFIFKAQKKSEKIKILKLTTSTEGRMIPLVVVSDEGISSTYEQKIYNKPATLIMANIHAGEIEGKEATLMLLREIANNKLNDLLKNQVILIIPIFNADGNEKLGRNRGDNGPELAGIRANGQNLDLNRDYMKIESPEIQALIKLFNEWDPVLIVDMHTTNGSYHREPVTYSTLTNPNTDKTLRDYMWNKFFPEVAKNLRERYNYDGIPYGNFMNRADPKGWRNHAFSAHYGSNYAGLRNRFTVLDENYSHADFKTRVLASFSFIKSILEYTNKNIEEMQKIIREADIKTKNKYFRENFTLEYKVEKLFDLTVKSYEFKKEKIKPEDKHKYPPWIKDFIVKKTDKLKDYKLPYYAKAVSTRSIKLPQGYIILPFQDNIIKNLKKHGIIVEKIGKQFVTDVEQFVIKELKLAKGIYQGHVSVTVKGEYKTVKMLIPKHSYFVSMKQPLARLIAELLEPEASSGLIKWGFFNRRIVRQWSRRPGSYPVYRITNINFPIVLFQE